MTSEARLARRSGPLFSIHNIATLALIIASFFTGEFITGKRAQTNLMRSIEARDRASYHREAKDRAMASLQLLNYLRDGKQDQATRILERQLDVAIIKCAGNWRVTREEDRDGRDIMLIRDARDYRSKYPQTSNEGFSDLSGQIEEAFKLVR